jgi:asparagine synthase (glutamine-hydrolysing)
MKASSIVSGNVLGDCKETVKVLPLGWTARQRVFVENGVSLFVDGFVDLDESVFQAGNRHEKGFADRLMNLYKSKGAGFLKQLRGTFALGLWDAVDRRVILAVDPFATRSLYYWSGCDEIAFAPRISCFSQHTDIPKEIDPNIIYFYLNHSFVPAPFTIYRHIKRLAPGQCLVWENGRVSLQQYWDMSYSEERDADEETMCEYLRAAVEDSIRFHLRYLDCPASERGAFLSGGTDSSTLVGLLSQITQQRVNTFSVGFEEERYNEIYYARIAASHFQCKAHEYFVRPDEALDAISLMAREYDEPFGNSSAIPTYFCLKMARDAGVKSMFAGDGGDELFGGNERYLTEKVFTLYHAIPSWIRRGTDLAAHRLPLVNPWRKVRNYIHKANQPVPDRFFSYQLYFRDHASEYFTDEFRSIIDFDFPIRIPRQHYERIGDVSPLNRLLYMDLKMAIADNDLFKVNRMAEGLGIQVCYPYLDTHVAAMSGTIPADLKLKRWTKRYIFKKAFGNLLPKEILTKRKHGFGLPTGDWLRSHAGFRDLARSLLLDSRSRQRGYFKEKALEDLLKAHDEESSGYYASQIWNFMMLELWHRSHADG